MRCLAQLALRLREAAFEISRMFLPHRGRPCPPARRKRVEILRDARKPLNGLDFPFYSITSSARASRVGRTSEPEPRVYKGYPARLLNECARSVLAPKIFSGLQSSMITVASIAGLSTVPERAAPTEQCRVNGNSGRTGTPSPSY